ncbi:MAG: flagellar hook-basal body complex protein [Verrucomicrobiota bacterium]
MLRALTSGVSGIQQFQNALDVIGNNIANSNTIAFKAARSDFADAFSQTLQVSSASSSGAGNPGMQVGSGVSTAAVRNMYTQGALNRTGVGTDLSISGDGFFMVRDPISNIQYATRAGDFRLDDQGYLVTNKGLRVQGFTDVGLTTRGDIQIDAKQRPPAPVSQTSEMTNFAVGKDGKINVNLQTGEQYVRGQVLLQSFRDPQALLKEGDNLYSGIGAAGPLGGTASPQTEAPQSNGLGAIEASSLELSNVDLANEFASLITTQRGFQANARIITTSDEILQELVNLKR